MKKKNDTVSTHNINIGNIGTKLLAYSIETFTWKNTLYIHTDYTLALTKIYLKKHFVTNRVLE